MERLNALQYWLNTDLGMYDARLFPASSDASFRRYFRVHWQDKTFIAMDAPPDKEDVRPFIRVAEMFDGFGLHVPQIHQRNVEQGFLLLSDMGNQDYLAALNHANADSLYRDAMDTLLNLQQGEPQQVSQLPPYDNDLLQREMALFRDWFISKHLQIKLDADEQDMLQSMFDLLANSALEQPRVAVHRDFHSRNLMVCPQRNPGVLDFQDAVYGPLTYDLVSLLRDCYISWPQAQLETWLGYFHQQVIQRGIIAQMDFALFQHWFDLMGVQRHLKAIGIFARLNWRDGKPRYLADIPRTLGYVLEVAKQREDLKPLGDFIECKVLRLLNPDGSRLALSAEAMA